MLKLAGLIHAGLIALCLGSFITLNGSAAPAVSAPAPALSLLPEPTWTDAQNRMMSGMLSPNAEALSQANALYAHALLHETQTGLPATLVKLQRVAALDSGFVDVQIKIAKLLLQSGHTDEALTQLRTALGANSHSAALKAMLGYLMRLQGQKSEGQRLCLEALMQDPSEITAMRVLLEIARDEGTLEASVTKISDLLNSRQVTASPWLSLARLYQEVANSDAHPVPPETLLKTLLSLYFQAAACESPDLESLTLLSDTYQQLGRKHEALMTLRRAQAISPANVDLLLGAAALETELGQKTAALQDYEKAYAYNPSLTGLRTLLARLYLDENQYANALPLLRESLADSPEDFSLSIRLGIAYQGLHQNAEAQACFQKVFATANCPPEAYLKLAIFQLDDQKIKEAASTLTAAQNRFPKSAEIRFYQAIQYRYAKNYSAALRSLAEVRALATDQENEILDVNYYLESALVLNYAGQKNQIEPTLREGLARYPDNSNLMNELAYVWADEGVHLSDALAYSRRAVELDPDNGPIQDTCGWVYFRMGQPKEALPYLQRAAIMTNNDPVVLQHVGDAYLTTGRRREAIATWRLAMEKDPGNHDLAHRIDAALAQANHAHLRSAPTK